jgi:hypothetical protein
VISRYGDFRYAASQYSKFSGCGRRPSCFSGFVVRLGRILDSLGCRYFVRVVFYYIFYSFGCWLVVLVVGCG